MICPTDVVVALKPVGPPVEGWLGGCVQTGSGHFQTLQPPTVACLSLCFVLFFSTASVPELGQIRHPLKEAPETESSTDFVLRGP